MVKYAFAGIKQWFYSKLYYQLTKQAANTNGASPLKNSFYRNEVNGRIKRHWEEGFGFMLWYAGELYFAIYLWL